MKCKGWVIITQLKQHLKLADDSTDFLLLAKQSKTEMIFCAFSQQYEMNNSEVLNCENLGKKTWLKLQWNLIETQVSKRHLKMSGAMTAFFLCSTQKNLQLKEFFRLFLQEHGMKKPEILKCTFKQSKNRNKEA